MQFTKDSYESKKRTRKLSDEPYALIEVGDTPRSPPLDQCVETEARNLTNVLITYLEFFVVIYFHERIFQRSLTGSTW